MCMVKANVTRRGIQNLPLAKLSWAAMAGGEAAFQSVGEEIENGVRSRCNDLAAVSNQDRLLSSGKEAERFLSHGPLVFDGGVDDHGW